MYLRNGRWYSDFYHDGKRYTKSWGAISKTAAKEKDRKLRTEVLEERHQRKKDNILFEKLVEEYLNLYASNKKSYKSYYLSRTRPLVRIFGKKRVLDMNANSFLIEKYKGIRKQEITEKAIKADRDIKDISFATINRELACAKHIFNFLRKKPAYKNFINPVAGVKMFKERSRDTILEYEEEPKLFEAIENNPQAQHLKPICVVALHSGMRLNEVLKLKKADVNLQKGLLVARDTKNGEDRVIPMNSLLTETLSEIINDGNKKSEYVFSKEDGTPYRSVKGSLETACRKAGIKRITFHVFRHTVATRLGEQGYHPKAIQEIMGWKDSKMAMRYTHPTPDYKRKAVESLCQVPSDLTTGTVTPIFREHATARKH